MRTYTALRHLRVAIAIAFALLLVWAIVDASFALTPVGAWVLSTQLVPAVLAGSAIWIVLWVLVTLTFGRVYCSTVCPLGTLQDAASRCALALGKRRGKRFRYSPPLNALRFPVAAIVALCLFAGFTAAVELTDPYAAYARIVRAVCRPMAMGAGSIAGAAVVLAAVEITAWRRGRLICNTVCPAGALLGFLSRSPVWRVDIDTDRCIHCGKCEDVCKAECIDLRHCTVDTSRCVMCLDCAAACPNDAIKVRRGRYRLSTPMMQPTR